IHTAPNVQQSGTHLPAFFYNFIFELENIFIENFPSISYEDGVGIKLKQQMNNVPFNHPCESFNKIFLINLFIRFRIISAKTDHSKTFILNGKKIIYNYGDHTNYFSYDRTCLMHVLLSLTIVLTEILWLLYWAPAIAVWDKPPLLNKTYQ
ncbi:Uncharacterized protein FWK35_00034266, partial [Aphis craccivora]